LISCTSTYIKPSLPRMAAEVLVRDPWLFARNLLTTCPIRSSRLLTLVMKRPRHYTATRTLPELLVRLSLFKGILAFSCVPMLILPCMAAKGCEISLKWQCLTPIICFPKSRGPTPCPTTGSVCTSSSSKASGRMPPVCALWMSPNG